MTISTTRRAFVGGSAIAMGSMLAACGGSGSDEASTAEVAADETASGSGAITGSYTMHIQGYDWGASVDQITLTLDAPLDAIDTDSLTVSEHKQVTDWTDPTFPVIVADVDRQVTAATINDDGTVTLDLYCSPNDGSPFLYTMSTGFNTWCDPYELNIAIADGTTLTSGGTEVTSFAIDPVCAGQTTSADAWTYDSYETADGITFNYAAWDPAEDSKSLVIWLHGAGEGGVDHTDPSITILGNKVVALSEDEFQSTVGGAHVVAPQCPTMWMDVDGNSTYISSVDEEGNQTLAADEITSFYTAALEEFIDAYIEKVGAEKVMVCGCSNGGFMTLWMAIDRPDKYSCIVPICEAVPDSLITDEQIASLKDLPIYFVYSKDDTTVIPDLHEVPTIERLKASGKTADTLHVSTSDSVVDTSGEYTDEEGNPYTYNGHWSWIYFDNNECACDEDGMKVFDFAAEYLK